MIIESIDLRGFGPVKRFQQRFKHENCIVGPNGGGKTTLLSVIAGVCGTDEATALIADLPVERCAIKVREGKEVFNFEINGCFDPKSIARFKETLPKRVNFALTEWTRTFPYDCVELATARGQWELYCDRHWDGGPRAHTPQRDFVYSPTSRSAFNLAGDGYKFAMSLFLNDSNAGTPVLYDNPSRHMDINGKRLMAEMLCREERQLFFTTHCPEMVLHEGWRGTNSEQLVVDIPKSKPKKHD